MGQNFRTKNSNINHKINIFWNFENILINDYNKEYKDYNIEILYIFADKDISEKYNHYIVTNSKENSNTGDQNFYLTDILDFIQNHSTLISNNTELIGSIKSSVYSDIDMTQSIYIDNNIDNLQRSNAQIKIFFDLDYLSDRQDILQKSVANNKDSFYIFHKYSELEKFLLFNLEYNLLSL